MTGTVKWFDDELGYGFITRDDGQGDIFVHYREILGFERGTRRTLTQGQKVEFEVGTDATNRVRAIDVKIL